MDFCLLLIAAINLAKLKLFRHYYVMVSKENCTNAYRALKSSSSPLDYLVEATRAGGCGEDLPRSVVVLWFGILVNWVTILKAASLLFLVVASFCLSLNGFQLFVTLTNFLWRQLELPVELMGLNNIL